MIERRTWDLFGGALILRVERDVGHRRLAISYAVGDTSEFSDPGIPAAVARGILERMDDAEKEAKSCSEV